MGRVDELHVARGGDSNNYFCRSWTPTTAGGRSHHRGRHRHYHMLRLEAPLARSSGGETVPEGSAAGGSLVRNENGGGRRRRRRGDGVGTSSGLFSTTGGNTALLEAWSSACGDPDVRWFWLQFLLRFAVGLTYSVHDESGLSLCAPIRPIISVAVICRCLTNFQYLGTSSRRI